MCDFKIFCIIKNLFFSSKLNISKITFTSGANVASQEYEIDKTIERCPLCGIALNENGICPKCGYRKP